ncbi:MAG: DNA mismatch repair endonuclease MutL [Brevinema sp.]
MKRINILDTSTAMKIAAGEVIERPASAVRELLDNSLDAGATWISVQAENGGKSFLSVQDNGHGIVKEDIALSFLNHTTSKIQNFNDLMDLKTFGFRGEALASLAEIAELHISSRTQDDDFGSEQVVTFGEPDELKSKGMDQGTEIMITRFFENVPARLKFLSSDTSEYRAIVQEFLKKALARPDVAFELTHNNEKKYHLLEAMELKDRIVDLFPDLRNVLQPFSYQENGIHAYGFLSPPSWYKPTRTYQYLFVNGRAIEWLPFRQQITVAYGNMLPPSKFPAVFCYLDIDPQRIDFNVHPQKREIRFEQEKLVSDVVRRAVRLGVEKAPHQDQIDQQSFEAQKRFPQGFVPQEVKTFSSSAPSSYQVLRPSVSPSFRPQNLPQSDQLRDLFEKKDNAQNMADILISSSYIGTIFQTYLLFEQGNKLHAVDFHAMHERIRYEKILNHKNDGLDSQTIIPLLFELPKHEAERFEEIEATLSKYGFQMHRMSETAFSVEAIPAIVAYADALNVLRELFVENIATMPWDDLAKMIACKGSVRSGDKLTLDEVSTLLTLWKDCQSPSSCPHGRPIVVNFDKYFFDKEFKRTGF